MRIVLLAGFILCSYLVSAQLTAIKCGKLIDGKNDQPLLNKAILIEGNRPAYLQTGLRQIRVYNFHSPSYNL